MPLQDVSVKINVASPAPKIGLGRPVIFVQKQVQQNTKNIQHWQLYK